VATAATSEVAVAENSFSDVSQSGIGYPSMNWLLFGYCKGNFVRRSVEAVRKGWHSNARTVQKH
jgi:hypothetical protein